MEAKLIFKPTCDCTTAEITEVSPSAVANDGTPICPHCGTDMEYAETQIVGDPILVYEVLNGIPHGFKLFDNEEDATSDFQARLEENVTDLSADDLHAIANDGSYDDGNGYEIYLAHPERG